MSTCDVDSQLLFVYSTLNRKDYYSLNLSYASQVLNISVEGLERLSHTSPTMWSRRFEELTGDHVNLFSYNGVRYIGLESRRLAYDEDRDRGTNWVEDAIRAGHY